MSSGMQARGAETERPRRDTPSPARAVSGTFAYELICDGEARDWAARGEGAQAWPKLFDECSWSTAFQSPGFFDVWCAHYAQSWSPLLLVGRRHNGTIAGVMPLAFRPGLITGAGTHQAEYHGWVSRDEDGLAFVVGALAALTSAMPGHTVRFRYLPPKMPAAILAALEANPRIELVRGICHEFVIERDQVEEALKKKGNKSKRNRLARMGKLDVRRLDARTVESHMDRLTTMYDFRQGAMNGVCPFLDDPHKRAFHLDWMKRLPWQLYASGMFLNDRLISAFLFAASPNDMHLAIAAHDPEFAKNSPSKLHLYEAALEMSAAGRATLDLTPGDDAWKERFSTGTRVACELVLHSNLQRAQVARTRRAAKRFVKGLLARLSISRQSLTERLRGWKSTTQNAIADLARAGTSDLLYRLAQGRPGPTTQDTNVSVDDLDALLRWGPQLAGQHRRAFLNQALHRIEAGDRCYAVRGANGLAALGWLSTQKMAETREPRTAMLYDLTAGDGAQASEGLKAIVTRMVGDLKMMEEAPLQILAAASSRKAIGHHVLTQLGFQTHGKSVGANEFNPARPLNG